jgi:2-phosphoglycerate kinase
MKELKIQRWFNTTLEMMKAMGKHNSATLAEGTVVVPADSSVRRPVLLLIGGGMGGGKSTVVKEIMQG